MYSNNLTESLFSPLVRIYLGLDICNCIILKIIICRPYIALYPRMSLERFTYNYPRHTWTHQHLNSHMEHTTQTHATRRHGRSMYKSFLCVLPGSHFTAEWTEAHFGYKSCPGTLYGGTRTHNLVVESPVLTTHPTAKLITVGRITVIL